MSKSPPNSDSKKALVDAFDTVLKSQAQQREAQLAEERRRAAGRPAAVGWISLFAVLLFSTYLWLERPIWAFPSMARPESTEVQEASLRIALANAARHVEHFHEKSGRWPATLEETGTLINGINYQRDGQDGYTLQGTSGSVQLTLHSTDSLRAFVGKSFDIISRRSR